MHYGSLVTAVASYLQARVNQGEWLVRIEDIDPSREVKGATNLILQTLLDFGFQWDYKPLLQSNRISFHKHSALKLLEQHIAYVCVCSRKDIANTSIQGPMGAIYPGTCRNKNLIYTESHTIRLDTKDTKIEFVDKLFGKIFCDLENESGDFVILRADQLPSYILAVSLDDASEQYTEIVRGADLLNTTPRQIHLNKALQLQYPQPEFLHIPIITHENGDKLSKQTNAPPIKKQHAQFWLKNALADLGQNPPQGLHNRPLWVVWEWACNNWRVNNIPRTHSIVMKH